MSETIAAVTVPFFIFGLPAIVFMVVKVMQHRERLEMIRNGMMPPAGNAWKNWQRAAAPPQRVAPVDDDDPQRTLKKGVVITFIGVALTIGLSFIGFLVDPPHFVLGPWLLGGLIPMFVGLAQVVTALLFGATFPAAPGARYSTGPERTSAPPPPPQNFEGAYTYRPDPNTHELGQSSPPDRR